MNIVKMLVLVALVWTGSALDAHALTTVRGTSNYSEYFYVGMVDVPGDSTTLKLAAVCIDGTGSLADRFITIGGWAGLNDDYKIHGDSTDTGTGDDHMYVIATNGTNPSGYCNRPGGWNKLLYAGNYLDLDGDGGDDFLTDGGGSNDTYMYGGNGDDYLLQYSSIGSSRGENDDDQLWGLSSGSGDALQGGNGADCLYDSTNTFTAFDCGGDTGDTRNYYNTGTTGCPNSSIYCGLF